MPDDQESDKEELLFPILRGESIAESGSVDGEVVIICNPAELRREWKSQEIAVLHSDLKDHLESDPGVIDELFSMVSAAICEFGAMMGDLASVAFVREAICIVKVEDATNVLENGMHIQVVAHENQGDVYFID